MIEIEEYKDLKKRDHPRKNAGWLSWVTLWYTIPIFREGNKRDFDENDLTEPLDEHKSSILGEKIAILWAEEIHRAKENHDVPNLTKVIFKMFLKSIILQGLCLFIIEIPVRLCQPLFLSLLLRYFTVENQNSTEPTRPPTYMMRIFEYWKEQGPISMEEALFLASGIMFCSLVNVAVIHPCSLCIMHVGMKMRVACCSLIYRKTLKLDVTALTGPLVGNVVNLMSTDVSRFDLAVMYFHYLWIAPLQLLLCLLLMYLKVGFAALVGISTILAMIPLQAWFGNRTSRFRLKTAYRTDERVRQMNEIIQAMQVIKMYTWENAFIKQIKELRRLEMKVLRATSFIRGAIMSFIMFTTRFAIFVTVLTILQRGRKITAEAVFAVTSFYQILRQTMTLYFPYAIAQIAETNVAVTRIKRYLMMPESSVGDPRPLNPKWKPETETKTKSVTDFSDLGLIERKRRSSTSRSILADSFPKIVLNKVSAKINDEVCLQNISLEIENKQLVAVIGQVGSGKSCLLSVIMGEMSPCVGTVDVQGVISYASQEPWLFAGSVRQNIIFGRKYEKQRYIKVVRACALVKDFELLPYGDNTIVGEKGASLSGGQRARINLARAVYRQADIYLLDDPLSAVDAHVGKHLFDKCISEFLSEKIVILVTHQLQFLSKVPTVVLMHGGEIEARGSYEFLQTTGFDYAEFLRNQLNVDADDDISDSANKVETLMKGLTIQSTLSLNIIDKEGQRYQPQQVAEIRTQGSVQCGVYKEYFGAGGNCCVVFCVMMLFFGAQALGSGCDYFLAAWIDVEEVRYVGDNTTGFLLDDLDRNLCISIYSGLIFSTMVIALTRSFAFFAFCMTASMNLHDRMFRSVITASMQFFNTNTSGRILNRFSKDLGAIDEILPNSMIDCAQIMLNLVGAAAVVTAVNYYLMIPTFLICVVFYLLRIIYIKTSRTVKRLEGISRSPVFAHLNATLQGLATVRSNKAEMLLTKEFDQLQDDHSSAWYMFISTSRAFGFWLDLICVAYIGAITYSFLIFSNTGSNVGLAITTALGLTGLFQWGMKQSAELENQMTSVERVLEYTKIEHEPDLTSKPDKKPPEDWPNEGKIQFMDLVMRYKPNDPPVLKSLNLVIQPKEKIGIVGRTGAGKSSLIAALFRLAYFDGSIVIDGIDTNQLGLHDLRKKISIIPQEPVLFSGNIRYNMDPFNNYEDQAIIQALGIVESRVVQTEGTDCLQHPVSEGGVNISVGERQMICLARAVLRNNRILVLDEATANIDPQTDNFIQSTIRQKFAQCTVLTIAHRLHTIMDSDRVLVMDAGNAVEFDHPYVLLNKKTGFFSSMVAKTGKAMANNLREVAKMNYELKHGQS